MDQNSKLFLGLKPYTANPLPVIITGFPCAHIVTEETTVFMTENRVFIAVLIIGISLHSHFFSLRDSSVQRPTFLMTFERLFKRWDNFTNIYPLCFGYLLPALCPDEN